MLDFKQTAEKIYQKAKSQKRLIETNDLERLKEIALKQRGVVLTKYGSLAANSEPQSRVAQKTKNSIDHCFGPQEERLAWLAEKYLSCQKIIVLEVPVADFSENISARFIIPEKFAQLAYGMRILFGKLEKKIKNPTYQIIFFVDEAFEKNIEKKDLAQKDIQIALWMGQKKGQQMIKICRNSIYSGEGKKGVFQFESWRQKSIEKNGIFLHAGVRKDIFFENNKKREVFSAIAGLSGTGKTTLLSRSIAKNEKEKSEILGDDGGTFYFDGSYHNFEKGGFYIKTESLTKEEQPEIYQAIIQKETFLENIKIKKNLPDFSDLEKTSNGRAIIKRENLKTASEIIFCPRIDYIFLITRNPLVNVISKLTKEQAVMQFIYGESIETSAGNPQEAGKFKREFFLDPFVTGSKIDHAMIFYEFLKRNPYIECFLINTGNIGQKERDISLNESLKVLKSAITKKIKFSKKQDILGYFPPLFCEGINQNLLVAQKQFFPNILEKKVKDFLKGRKDWLERLESGGKKIPKEIRNSLRWC